MMRASPTERKTVARGSRVRALVLALLVGGALAALGASADAAPFQTCATLTGKHLKSGGRAVVVTQLINRESQRSGIERVAYVCASPQARAWRVGAVGDVPEAPRIAVVAGAGEWVVLRFEYTIGEAVGESESAADALTGKHFRFWGAGGGMGSFDGSSLEAVRLDAHGRLALILGVAGKPQNEGEQAPIVKRNVVGVEPNGKRKLLETAPTASIPTSSLKLADGVVHWTNAGTERSAAP